MDVLLRARFGRGLEPAMRIRLTSELDDILQDAAVTAFRQLRGFEYRGSGSLLAWFGTIALRAAGDRLDYWRADKRSPAIHNRGHAVADTSQPGDGTPENVSASTPSALSELHRAEGRRRLGDALAELPERQQTIVMWRFFAGAEWADIAAEVESPSAEAIKMECVLKILPAIAAIMRRQAQNAKAD